MKQSETQISAAIGAMLDALGIYNLRLQSGKVKVRNGWMRLCPPGTPDRLVSRNRTSCYLEAKVPGESATAEQLAEHARILRLTGYRTFVVHDLDETKLALREMQWI